MDSGMDIYDAAHREDAAIAFTGNETGCGGVALLLALEVGVKFTLIGYARFRPLDSRSVVNKANDESKAACPNVFCPVAVSGRLAVIGLVVHRMVRTSLYWSGKCLRADIEHGQFLAVCQLGRRAGLWLPKYKVLSVVVEPFLILAGKPLYESEVGFLVLAFVFQLRFRFRIDKSLYSSLVCKFLNDVRQGFVAP